MKLKNIEFVLSLVEIITLYLNPREIDNAIQMRIQIKFGMERRNEGNRGTRTKKMRKKERIKPLNLEEIDEIKKKGVNVNPENFMISESASLILPFHQEMDEIREDAAGKSRIGTTRRGIGPCYEDKVGRRSIRVMDLRSETNLDSRLENVLLHHNAIRKGLKKKIFKKDDLKKKLLKIAPEILKFAKPIWLELDQFVRS